MEPCKQAWSLAVSLQVVGCNMKSVVKGVYFSSSICKNTRAAGVCVCTIISAAKAAQQLSWSSWLSPMDLGGIYLVGCLAESLP